MSGPVGYRRDRWTTTLVETGEQLRQLLAIPSRLRVASA